MKYLAKVESPFCREVQVLDDGRLTEPGHPDSLFLFSLLPEVPFSIEQQYQQATKIYPLQTLKIYPPDHVYRPGT